LFCGALTPWGTKKFWSPKGLEVPHTDTPIRWGREETAMERSPVRVGNGGHECRPAGRGADPEGWTCTVCSADWRAVTAVKAGITTITWERKMTEGRETR